MSDETTARLTLPMIQPGQAQKELSHNDALTVIDLLMQPCVLATDVDTPPATPSPGQAWIVGTAPEGAWAGKPKRIAGWTAGGWRFLEPIEGMAAWVDEVQQIARFSDGSWEIGMVRGAALKIDGETVVGYRRPAVADAAGGATVDAEARAAINAALAALRAHGLIDS